MKKIKLIPLALSLSAVFMLSACNLVTSFFSSNLEAINKDVNIAEDASTGKKGIYYKFFNILPCEYDSITILKGNIFKIEKNGKLGICYLKYNPHKIGDTKVEIVIPCKYDEISILTPPRIYEASFKIKKGNKYGACDFGGNVFLPCEYDNLYLDNNDLLIALEKNKKKGISDFKGRILLQCKYDDIFEDFRVKKGDKVGFVINNREYLSDVLCDNIKILSSDRDYEAGGNGCITTRNASNKKWGLFNIEGEIILPFEYDFIERSSSNKYYKTKKGDKSFRFYKDGYFSVEGKIHWNGVDIKFKNDYIQAEYLGKFGFMNTKEELVVPCVYDEVGSFENGYADVKKDGKWGVVDTKGQLVVPCDYDAVGNFGGGYAVVEQNSKKGVVDLKGNLLLDCNYAGVYNCTNGMFILDNGSKKGLSDNKGVLLVDYKYDDISDLGKGYLRIKLNNKVGLMNNKGEVLIPCSYDNISGIADKYIQVSKNGRTFYVDFQGNVVENASPIIKGFYLGMEKAEALELWEKYDYDKPLKYEVDANDKITKFDIEQGAIFKIFGFSDDVNGDTFRQLISQAYGFKFNYEGTSAGASGGIGDANFGSYHSGSNKVYSYNSDAGFKISVIEGEMHIRTIMGGMSSSQTHRGYSLIMQKTTPKADMLKNF